MRCHPLSACMQGTGVLLLNACLGLRLAALLEYGIHSSESAAIPCWASPARNSVRHNDKHSHRRRGPHRRRAWGCGSRRCWWTSTTPTSATPTSSCRPATRAAQGPRARPRARAPALLRRGTCTCSTIVTHISRLKQAAVLYGRTTDSKCWLSPDRLEGHLPLRKARNHFCEQTPRW